MDCYMFKLGESREGFFKKGSEKLKKRKAETSYKYLGTWKAEYSAIKGPMLHILP